MSLPSDRQLPAPGRQVNFATTHWSVVLRAGQRSSVEAEQALESLCESYWYPLYAYIRRRGYSPENSVDATQSFFVHVLEKQSLSFADPDRGRFRTFLLTLFRNFLADEHDRRKAQKRGGHLKHLSIDFDSGERRYQHEPTDDWTAERIYERRWALTLLDQAVAKLAEDYQAAGKEELFRCCKGHLTGVGESYSEIATQLGVTEGAVRVAVHRLRKRFRELLECEVAATLADEDGIEDELAYLRAAIRGEVPKRL